MISSRYGILCLILFLAALGLGFKNYEIWSQPAGAVTKREVPKKPEPKAEILPPAAVPAEITPREDYRAIAEKNIFHPERQEFPVTAGPEQAKPTARPQITLYGVAVGGNYQSATIIQPGRPLMKGEREAKTVKLGDRIGDYRVAKIEEDRIVMEASGDSADSFEVLLHDPGAPKKRIEVRTAVQPVAVTSAATAPPPPAAPAPPAPPRIPPGSPSPALQSASPVPQPAPPVAVPRPVEPTPGTALQPQVPPSPTTPGGGIWRGRRPVPVQPANPATPPQGN